MAGTAKVAQPKQKLSFNDPRVRGLIYQALALAAVAFCIWYLASNTIANLAARRIATGWGFLNREAGFAIANIFRPGRIHCRTVGAAFAGADK